MSVPTDSNLLRSFAYGRGYPTLFKAPDPAAGAPSVVSVPGSRLYRVVSVQGTFTASAAAATRTPTLSWKDADGVLWATAPAQGSVVALGTASVQFTADLGAGYTAGDGTLVVPLPSPFVSNGHRIELGATNIQAGDTFTAIHWYWEEFPTDGFGYPQGIQPQLPPHTTP